jgi:negative regulator of replication initiation
MPTIRIDNDVWAFLQTKAKPFVDTPNDVLRRELQLECLTKPGDEEVSVPEVRENSRPHEDSLIPRDGDYTGQRVRGYRLDGESYDARTFKDVLIGVCNRLRIEHLDAFDKVALGLYGKTRVYFSKNPKQLKYPHRLKDSNMFVETNLNANLIVGICRALLEALDHDIAEFGVPAT